MKANKGVVWSAGLLAAVLAGGCTPTYQFSGMLRYDNLMTRPVAREANRTAREELIERAASLGLEPVRTDLTRLVFRMRAPDYVVTLDDGSTEQRIDHRVVHVEARLDQRVGQDVYRYFCWVEGNEPAVFSDQNRARFGMALLAVRELMETPIHTEFLGGG